LKAEIVPMIINLSPNAEAERLARRLSELAPQLVEGLEPAEADALVPRETALTGPDAVAGRFFRLIEGNVAILLQDQPLYVAEPGELIGLEAALGAALGKAYNDFAVRVDIYEKDALLSACRENPARLETLAAYLAAQAALLSAWLVDLLVAARRPAFRMQSYAPGEEIIRQGATDTDVYSMLSGRAEVIVDGRQVGEIRENEIFGEMSRLTGQPRTATVRAATPCEAMIYSGEEFARVTEANPAALMEIARHLSERLVQANREAAQAVPEAGERRKSES